MVGKMRACETVGMQWGLDLLHTPELESYPIGCMRGSGRHSSHALDSAEIRGLASLRA